LFELHESGLVPGQQLNGKGPILFRLSEVKAAITKNRLVTKPRKG